MAEVEGQSMKTMCLWRHDCTRTAVGTAPAGQAHLPICARHAEAVSVLVPVTRGVPARRVVEVHTIARVERGALTAFRNRQYRVTFGDGSAATIRPSRALVATLTDPAVHAARAVWVWFDSHGLITSMEVPAMGVAG